MGWSLGCGACVRVLVVGVRVMWVFFWCLLFRASYQFGGSLCVDWRMYVCRIEVLRVEFGGSRLCFSALCCRYLWFVRRIQQVSVVSQSEVWYSTLLSQNNVEMRIEVEDIFSSLTLR